jgi:hypothetical protein
MNSDTIAAIQALANSGERLDDLRTRGILLAQKCFHETGMVGALELAEQLRNEHNMRYRMIMLAWLKDVG